MIANAEPTIFAGGKHDGSCVRVERGRDWHQTVVLDAVGRLIPQRWERKMFWTGAAMLPVMVLEGMTDEQVAASLNHHYGAFLAKPIEV